MSGTHAMVMGNGGGGGGGGGDPSFASVSLLLHFDGTDGSTTFTDSSGLAHSVTANGNAQIDTAQSVYGGASGLFDGTGDYLSIADSSAWHFGSGDFTIEARVRFAALPASGDGQVIVGQWPVSGNLGFDLLLYNPAGTLNLLFNYTGNGASQTDHLYAWTPSTGVWYGLAVVRSGTNLYMFIDGALVYTGAIAGSLYDSSGALTVGSITFSGFPYALNGHLDELRITKGVARYTGTYTLAGAAFPNS